MSCIAKNLLCGVCLILSALMPVVFAQEQSAVPQELLAHLAEIEVLEGTFQQTRHIAVLAIPLHSSGNFHYQREQGIVWSTAEPVANEIHISHEQGIVAIDERGATRALPSSEVVASIFLNLFAGELNRLRDYFEVEAVDAATTEAAHPPASDLRRWALRLTPTLPALASQIEYILVSGRDHVDSVVIQDANGDWSELSLTLTQPGENPQP